MAIGSAPEIGTRFKNGLWTRQESTAWHESVGPDGVGGYAKIAYADRTKYLISEFPLVPYLEVT